MSAGNGFDAYYKWLGIPAKQQPAHYYRLLGLEMFESDADMIDSAADARLSFLRKQDKPAYSQLARKLMHEVAAARGCLLNSEARAAYDAQLRRGAATSMAGDRLPSKSGIGKAATIAHKVSVASATPTPGSPAPPKARPASSRESPQPAVFPLARPADARRRARRGTNLAAALLAGAAVLGLTVLVVFVWLLGAVAASPKPALGAVEQGDAQQQQQRSGRAQVESSLPVFRARTGGENGSLHFGDESVRPPATNKRPHGQPISYDLADD